MLLDAGCVVCGGVDGPVCGACCGLLVTAPPLDVGGLNGCRAAFQLDHRSREVVAAFKYRQERRIARWLAAEMAKLMPLAADRITWIPTTSQRRRRRGYDQARELALALSRVSGVPVTELLCRKQRDRRQTGQSRAMRLTGPALQVCGSVPSFVVVVDDVVTTGSSLRTGADLLRQEGANRVVGLVAAAALLKTPSTGSRLPLWK